MNTTELIERLSALSDTAEIGYVVWDGSIRSFVRYTINAVAEDGTLVGEGPQTVAQIVATAGSSQEWAEQPSIPETETEVTE